MREEFGTTVIVKTARLLCIAIASLISAAPAQQTMVPDFALPDVNSTSLRRRATSADLSPRNYLHQITAYYFANEG